MCGKKTEPWSLLPSQYVSHGRSSFTAPTTKLQHPGELEVFVAILVVIWVTLVSRKMRKRPKTLGLTRGWEEPTCRGLVRFLEAWRKGCCYKYLHWDRQSKAIQNGLFFLSSMHTASQRRRKTALLTVALSPSGAMPQFIYLMLQLEFFLSTSQSVAALWLLDSTETSHQYASRIHENGEELTLTSLATVSFLPSLSWPRLQTVLTPLELAWLIFFSFNHQEITFRKSPRSKQHDSSRQIVSSPLQEI